MKQVRCPACRRLHADPPMAFACAGCGVRLRWAGEWTGFTSQLPLFDVGSGQQELIPADTPAAVPPTRPEQPAASERLVGSPTSTRFQEAVSLVVGSRLLGEEGIIPAMVDVLTGRPPEELCELVLCCASMAGWFADDVDRIMDGAGTARLQMWSLAAAGFLPEEE